MGSEVNGLLVAAHDLKAPLSLLRQLTLSLEISDDPATRNRIQSQLVATSERALRQVNDLTKIARLGDGLFEMEPVSVRAVCDDVYRELNPVFRLERRQLKLIYHNHSRLATAHPELLHSIVYNFCTNAAHYSTLETESLLSVSDHDGRIRVAVRDFGPALPPKIWHELKKGKIMKPVQVAMRPDSSGLGLYIASEFASHMHADFGAVRHRDGTSFFIDLLPSAQASLF